MVDIPVRAPGRLPVRAGAAAVLAAALFAAGCAAPGARAVAPGAGGYAGSERCGDCHRERHESWRGTLHALFIRDAAADPGAVRGDFAQPDLPFTRDQVRYVVGAHWDQRYLTAIGNELYVLPRLWSMQSRKWQPYNAWTWRQRPWSRYCAGCHVTGLDAATGAWRELSIGCEACHGPGGAHAAAGAAPIVNPARLPGERRDMVCAACHVRGTDRSGYYSFPVGFRPGGDLAEALVPESVLPGETPGGAIRRLFQAWRATREGEGRAKCEVCGIYGSSARVAAAPERTAFCLKCHDFGADFSGHSRHGASVGCLACHRARAPQPAGAADDVHSAEYYRIHRQSCYDPRIEKACAECHGKSEAWADEAIARLWKREPGLDH